MDIKEMFKDDVGLNNVKIAVYATNHTAKILQKYGKITPKLPITVPHTLIYGAAGCHAKDTGIIMYDGSIKKVQDIVVGNLLMGPDSQSRKVKKLYRGKEQLYKITTISGEEMVVNENHILNLIKTRPGPSSRTLEKVGNLTNISIKDYLTKNKTFKRYHLLYQPGIISFKESDNTLPLDPYFLGLLLGDGYFGKWSANITTGDPEIENEILDYALNNDLQLSANRKDNVNCVNYSFWSMQGANTNILINSLKNLNLFHTKAHNKFIPHIYKASSIENRYKILAGLLDTDGHYTRCGFDYVSKSKQLANDVIFIAKSLGLRTHLSIKKILYKGKQLEYSRVSITGNCHLIPTKIKRKRAEKRTQIKDPLIFSFTVVPVGVGDYFGFELNKDHLYLTENFLVHHNSGKTKRSEAMAELMGCSEKENTFIRINSDSIEKIENFIEILDSKLSWQGYKNDGHKITDYENPVAPIKPVLIFLDEIHCLSKTTQEKLGLILLDFRYQVKGTNGIKTIYFPKFTLVAATTKPGDLIKPLRTRFGIKIAVDYGTDQEMVGVVNNMLKPTGWNLSEKCKTIVANMAQGIPREAGNHLTGLYNCWIYSLYTGQTKEKCCIMEDIAIKYAKLQKYTLDGISYDQIRVLRYLASFLKKDGKRGGAGVMKICSALSLDQEQFMDTYEPRLIYRGFITSGTKGRELTDKGYEYLERTLATYKDISNL